MAGRMGDKVMAALMNGMAREESSEDEDEVDHEKIVEDAYAKMKMKMKAMCAVAAGRSSKASAAVSDRCVRDCDRVRKGSIDRD